MIKWPTKKTLLVALSVVVAAIVLLMLARGVYCPSQRIDNRMPTGRDDVRLPGVELVERNPPTDYYIKDGVRVELDEFPEWMWFVCLVPTSTVY
jgi:hypothetical protein